MRRVMVTIRISWWRRIRGREITTGEVPDAVRRSGEDGDPAVGEVDLDLALRALRALPRRQQVAVVLRHYCDLSEAETASLMGITVGGVKSQTSKGLAALRVALPPSAVNEEPIR
jgi:RNA polymerase sigma factor (sigma-70 family)